MNSALYFVENLTLRTWWLSVWPRLLLSRLRGGRRVIRCYVIDASPPAMLVAWASARLAGVAVERFEFQLVDVRDEAGLLIRLRIAFQDLAEAQNYAIAEPTFRELVGDGSLRGRLPMFVAKNIAAISLSERGTMWRALLLVQVCVWKAKRAADVSGVPVLFLERRPWLGAIKRYGNAHGISMITVRPAFNLRATLRRWLPSEMISQLRYLRHRLSWRSLMPLRSRSPSSRRGVIGGGGSAPGLYRSGHGNHDPKPCVAVEYQGQLNLNQPERHSDLFFWQRSYLKGSDLLVTFVSPSDPLDDQKWAQLREHGMAAVALHPGATVIPDVPVFTHHPRPNRTQEIRRSARDNGVEKTWIRRQIASYRALREYWTDLLASYNVKVHVTWYKYNSTHMAIADALNDLGGVTAIYQRAYESHPSAETTINADIVFGFCQQMAEVERRSNSIIQYHVTTGYIGDHRFALLRNSAHTVRDALKSHGAKRILAFFDENSGDDSRWHTGHPFMRANYAFLLDKVLDEPWLGLVIKPKTPRTLRRRLGPVAELLDRAESTGRCYVYKEGAVQGSRTPVEAALEADIAIHGHLCGATAGMEAALAGVPTLLLDREGWPVSPLYRLGVGRVAFTDWQGLWEACQEHWSSPVGMPGFGDWSPMLGELDPFRDGRAAERMGTYIQWLIEGFQAGLDRETVMADAAERYCGAWGRDKITQVSGGLLLAHPPGQGRTSKKAAASPTET